MCGFSPTFPTVHFINLHIVQFQRIWNFFYGFVSGFCWEIKCHIKFHFKTNRASILATDTFSHKIISHKRMRIVSFSAYLWAPIEITNTQQIAIKYLETIQLCSQGAEDSMRWSIKRLWCCTTSNLESPFKYTRSTEFNSWQCCKMRVLVAHTKYLKLCRWYFGDFCSEFSLEIFVQNFTHQKPFKWMLFQSLNFKSVDKRSIGIFHIIRRFTQLMQTQCPFWSKKSPYQCTMI